MPTVALFRFHCVYAHKANNAFSLAFSFKRSLTEYHSFISWFFSLFQLMTDHSLSSPPTPRRLNAERGISGSAEGESETHDSSSSEFQPHSHNNAPSPRTFPPPPPTTANSIPGSEARWRRTMLRSRKPMATSHIPQDFPLPFGLNFLPPPSNSPTLQELGPQRKPTSDTNNPIPIINISDSMHQDSPLPTSTDLEMGKELCSEMEQDLSPSIEKRIGMDPVSVLRPSSSNVPHITHQTQRQRQPIILQFAGNYPDPLSPESVSSNDCEAGSSSVNQGQPQQQQPPRMITTSFPPEDGDPDQDPNIWVRPPPDYYKLNVAVALCNSGGINLLGLGAVVRDRFGAVQAAVSLMWHDFINLNPAPAESFIYNVGVVLSLQWGYNRLIAETESLWLVEQYRAPVIPGLHFEQFTYFHAKQVSRNANSVAHRFARMAPVRENIFWTARDIEDVFGSNLMPY